MNKVVSLGRKVVSRVAARVVSEGLGGLQSEELEGVMEH
jgi:hypothetical protein